MEDLLANPFIGTPPAALEPFVVTGPPGAGKSTTMMMIAGLFGARINYVTRQELHEHFAPRVNWDEIDVVIIDELNGWDSESIRAAFPRLMQEAKLYNKGLILIGQDVLGSPIGDLLPADMKCLSFDNLTVRRLATGPTA